MRDSVPELGTASAGGRYTIERMLGSGGMGAVYLARDHETGEHVALKKLLHVDAKSVLRLKREFRSVADLDHPNLIKLYDLERAEDGWMLAMEYVKGQDLLSHVQQLGAWVDRSTVRASVLLRGLEEPISGMTETLPSLRPHDRNAEALAQRAFHQVACGVRALHRAGMLHRDLKPSNVLVAADRVVVLDFGLVRELGGSGNSLTEAGVITGTPAYMAPEQARGLSLSEATDWYAFGAMLYEALTGHLPFDGGLMDLLLRKLETDPTPAKQLNPSAPQALCDLCMALLARDPAARPGGEQVLAQLALPAAPGNATSAPPLVVPVPATFSGHPGLGLDSLQPGETTHQSDTQTQSRTAAFFGRRAELAALFSAMDGVREGRSAVVHVRGPSGAGKSALVEHFLDELEADGGVLEQPDALVLRSRCYEREAMPFKALDGLMDALVRHLSHLDDVQVGHLLPADVDVLARLFPVLERLRVMQKLRVPRSAGGDGAHDRRRAGAALRDLIARLAARQALAIWIDDLQWGDLDSAALLEGWLKKPLEVPLLLVFSYRSDEVETSPCLRQLLQPGGERGPQHEPSAIVELAALDAADIDALCRERLGERARTDAALLRRIAQESQGNPFWATQLAALAQAKIARGDDPQDVSIEGVLSQTRALLPPEASALLSVLAVAGRPMPPKLALRAAGVRAGGRNLVHALRGLRLARTRDVIGERLLEVYHDRVREGVQASLGAEELAHIQARLLATLEHSGRAEPDWLHELALGAGQRALALSYGLAAAERARATLAFERAADLYRSCLSLSAADAPDRCQLLRKLAAMLAQTGKGALAAEAELQAAELSEPAEAIRLKRIAASHLLRSGRFEEGERLLAEVLAALDVDVPKSDAGLVAAIAWERMRLKLRGLGYTLRSEQDVPAELLARIDLYHALRSSTQVIDTLRAVLFSLRATRWALDSGEPSRVARALANTGLGAVFQVDDGGRTADQLLEAAERLAAETGSPATRAFVQGAHASAHFLLGRLSAVIEPSYEAERIFRSLASEGDGESYYTDRVEAISARVGALYVLGDFRRFLSELRATVEEAELADNRSALLHLAYNTAIADDIQGCPERSLSRLTMQREQLPAGRFAILHVLHMAAVARTACSTGRYDWGMPLFEADWQRYGRSPLRRSPFIIAIAHGARARLLLNHHAAEGDGDVAALVAPDLKALDRLGVNEYLRTQLLRARVALLQQNRALALELLRNALQSGAIAFETDVHRYALGLLQGGDAGASTCAEAERALSGAGVARPLAYVRGFYPELFPAE